MSIYVQSNQIISELRCHINLLTSSKAVPLCLKQVLVVRTSLIQLYDTRTSFFNYFEVFMCHFLHNLPRFYPFRVAYTANDEFRYDFSLAIFRSRVA